MPSAVDTNVLVRLATGDDPVQHAQAERFVAAEQVLLLPTVLLETEWVLRSLYGYSPAQFVQFAEWFTRHPQVTVHEPAVVEQALRLHALGFDFADGMHLAYAGGKPFVTFDRALERRARRDGLAVSAPGALPHTR